MSGDELLFRGGTDIFVFGNCRSPRPVTRSEVTVEVGSNFRASVAVFGKRVWRKRLRGFEISTPEPFTEMPLTLKQSFGGEDEWDGLQVKYPSNPFGKGFSHTDEHTDGRELPNVEDPQHLIKTWNDQPIPVGVCPAPPCFAPRAVGAMETDPKTGAVVRINPKLFNAAFPAFVAPPVEHGELIRVLGVTGGAPLEFRLPKQGPIARLMFHTAKSRTLCPIDQIGVEVGRNRVFLSFRYAFRYTLVSLQRRSCELLWPDRTQAGRGPGLAEADEQPGLPRGEQRRALTA